MVENGKVEKQSEGTARIRTRGEASLSIAMVFSQDMGVVSYLERNGP
jgi:hypothetical protein